MREVRKRGQKEGERKVHNCTVTVRALSTLPDMQSR